MRQTLQALMTTHSVSEARKPQFSLEIWQTQEAAKPIVAGWKPK